MIIKAVNWQRVKIPLAKPYLFGRGPVGHLESMIIRLEADNGLVGVGECVVRAIISSLDEAERRLSLDLVPALIGMDPMDVEAILLKLQSFACPDLGPVAGLELALWDLKGKHLGLPAYKLLGGGVDLDIPVSYTLGIGTPQDMALKTLEMSQYRYQTFVVKVGHGTIKEDVDRVRFIREAVGPDVKLRLDANAAYNVDQAIEVLKAIEEWDIEYIEQPIRPGDLEGIKKVALSTQIPICIDEGLETLKDALELAKTGAVSFFNIKPPQVGGLWLSKKIAGVAESAGIACICGGRMALEVIREASRHFVASTPAACTGHAHEGPGPASQALISGVTQQTVGFEDVRKNGGFVKPSEGPGLGINLDEELLGRYAVKSGA